MPGTVPEVLHKGLWNQLQFFLLGRDNEREATEVSKSPYCTVIGVGWPLQDETGKIV